MIRTLSCVALLAFVCSSAARADDKAKPKEPEAKPQISVPRELQGSHAEKRLIQLQTDLDAAMKNLGPARQEADKTRNAAIQAENKVNDLVRTVKNLEEEKSRTLTNALRQAREDAVNKTALETSQKLHKLEFQLRDLTAQLAAYKQQKSPAATPAPSKDKPAASPEKKKETADK